MVLSGSAGATLLNAPIRTCQKQVAGQTDYPPVFALFLLSKVLDIDSINNFYL